MEIKITFFITLILIFFVFLKLQQIQEKFTTYPCRLRAYYNNKTLGAHCPPVLIQNNAPIGKYKPTH